MNKRLQIVAAGLLGLLLVGCPDDHEAGGHAHGAEGHGEGGDMAVPKDYVAAVAKCKELSGQIDGLIADGKLTSVHPPADHIKKIAESLAELAKSELPKESLRDVNVKATELAGLFSKIDAAADANKKEDTIAVHDEMKKLIADLEKLGAGAKPAKKEEDGHDDHGDH